MSAKQTDSPFPVAKRLSVTAKIYAIVGVCLGFLVLTVGAGL